MKKTIYLNRENRLANKDFAKEKDLEAWLCKNIGEIFGGRFGEKVEGIKRQHGVEGFRKFSVNRKSVDVYVETDKNSWFIELKNPKYQCENLKAIGQVLDYGLYAPKGTKLLLITTMFDEYTAKVIAHHKLPIQYMYISKKENYLFERMAENDGK